MARQLRFLCKLNTTANVTVRVVPSGISEHAGSSGSFTLYDLRQGLIGYLRHHAAGSFIPDHDGDYRSLVNQLDQLALPKQQSSAAISQLAVGLDPNTG
ncbi:hypothetical protein GCM10022222_00090 [Amycolatopsis ultiminotia]|uniref:DUF5753 domain-containing protein n=1 Tax=Amycolatopsis ultiminotia TaxID=543629 RepID=A0ABP6UTR4_9PSEU